MEKLTSDKYIKKFSHDQYLEKLNSLSLIFENAKLKIRVFKDLKNSTKSNFILVKYDNFEKHRIYFLKYGFLCGKEDIDNKVYFNGTKLSEYCYFINHHDFEPATFVFNPGEEYSLTNFCILNGKAVHKSHMEKESLKKKIERL